jgi:hypothetical protein
LIRVARGLANLALDFSGDVLRSAFYLIAIHVLSWCDWTGARKGLEPVPSMHEQVDDHQNDGRNTQHPSE